MNLFSKLEVEVIENGMKKFLTNEKYYWWSNRIR